MNGTALFCEQAVLKALLKVLDEDDDYVTTDTDPDPAATFDALFVRFDMAAAAAALSKLTATRVVPLPFRAGYTDTAMLTQWANNSIF